MQFLFYVYHCPEGDHLGSKHVATLKIHLIVVLTAIYFSYYKSNWRAVAQLVEELRFKPEGRGFDSRWCRWNFSLT